jgi:hypothetical protein
MIATHCFFCTPCCCQDCDPWTYFTRSWDGLALAVRNPAAARWFLGVAA